MVEILEPINVWVFFKSNFIQPYLFFWKDRQIKVDKVNLIHTSRNGASLFYHFSLSSGSNFYQISFDSYKLRWFLEKVEEG
ncbi:MAG: hypothetical protein M1142_02285 [Patescibacteria group bacterium]|nr:hypothetical protein [Patescibacteria group bacterium]